MKNTQSRFASIGDNGEILSLIAEGDSLPDYPADIATLSDADLGVLHDAYAAEAAAMAAGEVDFNEDRAAELTERIPALRVEAQRRIENVDAQLAELAALTADELADVVAYAAATASPPTPAPAPEDRAAQLAALAALNAPEPPPAPVVDLSTVDPAEVAAATARGVAEGLATGLAPVTAALAEAATALTAARTTVPAVPTRPLTARDLGTYRPDDAAPTDPANSPRTPRGRLIHSGEVPGFGVGEEFQTMDRLVNAFVRRHEDIGQSAGEDEKVMIASYKQDSPPESRDLRGMTEGRALKERIRNICGPNAMGIDPWNLSRELPLSKGGIIVENPDAVVASGGLAAPVEPYYPQLLLAEADRVVMGAMPSFIAERGGIRLVQPAGLGTLTAAVPPGLYTNGVTNTDTSLVSSTAAFTQADVGKPVLNAGASTFIPAGTVINSVTNGTTVVLSAATTGTGTGQSFYLPARNPNNLGGPVGVVTAAQDAAGPPNTVKFTYDVPDGNQIEHDVYSIYTSLQFANLTARTFPEQVELNIMLANALAARVADTKALDYITGWSTLMTGAKTFGTARQLLAQFEHMAAYYRNHNRMDPSAVLRLGIPAWALNAMRGDYISTFIGGGDNWGLSDDELSSWFQDRSILPFFYWDGPSDVSQLFPSPGSGAINTNGVNNATPIAIPDYPGAGATSSFRTEVVSFMWAEGTWLGLTTGELNIGLVRDSILNSQNRFRNFEEVWETPAFVGLESLRCVHTVAADGTYGAAVSVTLGAGSGL